MCKCTPEKRTPFCGKPGCEWPKQRQSIGEAIIPVEFLERLLTLSPRYKILRVIQHKEDLFSNVFRVVIEDSEGELYRVDDGGKVPIVSIEYEKTFTKVVK